MFLWCWRKIPPRPRKPPQECTRTCWGERPGTHKVTPGTFQRTQCGPMCPSGYTTPPKPTNDHRIYVGNITESHMEYDRNYIDTNSRYCQFTNIRACMIATLQIVEQYGRQRYKWVWFESWITRRVPTQCTNGRAGSVAQFTNGRAVPGGNYKWWSSVSTQCSNVRAVAWASVQIAEQCCRHVYKWLSSAGGQFTNDRAMYARSVQMAAQFLSATY